MRALLFSLFVLLCCCQCHSPKTVEVDNNTVSLSNGTQQAILNDYKVLLVGDHSKATPIEVWTYEADQNNVQFDVKSNKEAALAAYNHRLYLQFEPPILQKNKKTLHLHPQSPFGHLEKEGAYSKPLRVNGMLYSGILMGYNRRGQLLLSAAFYEGIRVGGFMVVDDTGEEHHRSFDDDMPETIRIDAVRKPVLYLYPKTPQSIHVQVDFNGQLTHSYPHYPAGGWQVLAQPDGTLLDEQTGKTYPYLFWEGQSDYHYQLNRGAVVAKANTINFLEEKLAYLGLNRREATDFITYWMPELERSPYNLIHFSTQEYQDQAPLRITPVPETLIRVFMVYQPLPYPIKIAAQILEPIERKGYTVVEWGGKRSAKEYPSFFTHQKSPFKSSH